MSAGPEIPEDVRPDDLDPEIRAELRTLPRQVADTVARHLVAAGELMEVAPERAHEHAVAARRLAPRLAVVREAAGLTAYRAEQWQTAVAELRTYHRMSGRQTHLAVLADCERAMGRPHRAIDFYRAAPTDLPPQAAVELRIVASGAYADLGETDQARELLEVPDLTADPPAPWTVRLRYAYANLLLEAGRREEAREWFSRAADVDEEGETDAAERLLELDGVALEEAEPEPDETDESEPEAAHRAGPGAETEPGTGRVGQDGQPGEDGETGPEAYGTERPGPEPEGHGADRERHGPEQGRPEVDPSTRPAPAAESADLPEPESAAVPGPVPPARLVDAYDLVILDLDGVLLLGREAIPAAVTTIAALRKDGPRLMVATNNASRGREELAELLAEVGIPVTAEEVVTSAMVAADTLAGQLDPGSPVLVVGTEALADELRRVGLRPVRSADGAEPGSTPVAVVQGYGPRVDWSALAEAMVAIRAGARWVLTNADVTLPSPRGPLPGNGSLSAVLRTALGRGPDLVVGKPAADFFAVPVRQARASAALVVGDRLDTDIAGANRAGVDSLLVFTGVTDRARLARATGDEVPTYVGEDLAALLQPGVRYRGGAG